MLYHFPAGIRNTKHRVIQRPVPRPCSPPTRRAMVSTWCSESQVVTKSRNSAGLAPCATIAGPSIEAGDVSFREFPDSARGRGFGFRYQLLKSS
jgi:hypothetical protein